MQNKISILTTRPLDDELTSRANKAGITIDISPFIETEAIESVEIQQEIEAVLNAAAVVVFTSMNAVEAVEENRIDEQPAWLIYCIGQTTAELVKKYFPYSSIEGTADDAGSLAALIISEANTEEVVFFCGDKRRDELPALLRENGIDVNEIVVYQTISLPHKIKNSYHGILFFSPSAVDSFFAQNKTDDRTVLFAIGNTTAAEIRKHTSCKIIIGDQPGKEKLFEKMMEYFT